MKTELQKMLDGDLYIAVDPQLVDMRDNACKLMSRYNKMIAEPLEPR